MYTKGPYVKTVINFEHERPWLTLYQMVLAVPQHEHLKFFFKDKIDHAIENITKIADSFIESHKRSDVSDKSREEIRRLCQYILPTIMWEPQDLDWLSDEENTGKTTSIDEYLSKPVYSRVLQSLVLLDDKELFLRALPAAFLNAKNYTTVSVMIKRHGTQWILEG